MKKITIFVAISLFAASSAFASGDISMDSNLVTSTKTGLSVYAAKTGVTAATGVNLIGKTSTGVGVGIKSTTVGYAVVTQHKNGTKAFGSSFDSTSIYSAPVSTVGTSFLVIPGTADSADFVASGSAWSTM
jgi:hypothetical protein